MRPPDGPRIHLRARLNGLGREGATRLKINADLAHVLAQLRACGYFGWRKPDIHLERSKTFSRGDLLMDLLALEARRFILAVTRQPPNGPLLCLWRSSGPVGRAWF